VDTLKSFEISGFRRIAIVFEKLRAETAIPFAVIAEFYLPLC